MIRSPFVDTNHQFVYDKLDRLVGTTKVYMHTYGYDAITWTVTSYYMIVSAWKNRNMSHARC